MKKLMSVLLILIILLTGYYFSIAAPTITFEAGVGGGGETNTVSNTGSAGQGLYKQKTGVDFELYKVSSTTPLITWELDGTDKINLTFNPSYITETGVINTGTWNGTSIADAYIDNDITLTNLTQITNRASTDLTDSADLLFEAELDSFSELQTQIADATVVIVGTLTDTKYCTWDNAGSEIDCNSEGGSTSPGGSDTHVQYNDGGSFGGSANFTYDGSTLALAGDMSVGGGNLSHTLNGVSYDSLVELHQDSDTADPMGLSIHRHGDTDVVGGHLMLLRSRGTHATPTPIVDGDYIGRISAFPYDGTDYSSGATIDFIADGGQGDNDNPMSIVFSTTPDASNTWVERMRIQPDGDIDLSANSIIDLADPTNAQDAATMAYVDVHADSTANPHSVTKAQVGLTNVEDTALSTWAGTANITTVGTIGAGVWAGTSIADAYVDNDITLDNLTQITTSDHADMTAGIGTLTHAELDSHISSTDKHVTSTAIAIIIGNGTDEISAGIAGDVQIPFDFTITKATMLGHVSGTVEVDIWADSYANYPPLIGDSICSASCPSITTGIKSEDTTLSGWTVSFIRGTILRYNVTHATTTPRVTLMLEGVKE